MVLVFINSETFRGALNHGERLVYNPPALDFARAAARATNV